MRRTSIAKMAAAVCVLIIPASAVFANDFIPGSQPTMQQIGWMQKCEQLVRGMLRDPESAKFRNLYFRMADVRGQRIPVTCGEVNAKNGFGGYGGYEQFVSAGSRQTTFLSSQSKDWPTIWRMLCH